jgi:hypothetical protein
VIRRFEDLSYKRSRGEWQRFDMGKFGIRRNHLGVLLAIDAESLRGMVELRDCAQVVAAAN